MNSHERATKTTESESDQWTRLPRKLLQQRPDPGERLGLFLQFGTIHQKSQEEVEIRGFQGIYLSPQQAKALLRVLHQNIAQYETAFGEIKLDPNAAQVGAVQ